MARIILFVLILILSCLQCDSSREKEDKKMRLTDISDENIHISYVRPAASGSNTAAYFIIRNESENADTLVSFSSNAASLTELHESYETEDGMMGMRKVENMIVQPGDSLILKQGGLHIMLMGLNRSLNVGDTVKIEYIFTNQGVQNRNIEVQLPES